ncbi:MAG: hypothetical protein V4692_13200 [Bdellovibrionota bacterium]
MKRSMNGSIGLTMAALMLFIGGCTPKQDNATTVGFRSGTNTARAQTANGQSVNGIQLNGVVMSNSSYQTTFNEMVRQLMEMIIDGDSVGYVAAQPDGTTGLYAGAKVVLQNGAKVRNGSASAYASTSSRLVLRVYDKFADVNPAPLPPMEFKLIQGYVNGNYAELEFQQIDKSGRAVNNYIRLAGNLNSSWFSPRMYYDVQNAWDGADGGSGYFDYLNIPTCDVFECN